MRYRLVLRCDQEYLFNFLTKDLKQTFNQTKKAKTTEISKGLTFSTKVDVSKKVSKYVTVKVLEFDKPHKFAMEYTSDTYHKISNFEINKIDEYRVEFIYEMLEEKIADDKVIKTTGSYLSNEIKKAPLTARFQYMDIAAMLRDKKIDNEEI